MSGMYQAVDSADRSLVSLSMVYDSATKDYMVRISDSDWEFCPQVKAKAFGVGTPTDGGINVALNITCVIDGADGETLDLTVAFMEEKDGIISDEFGNYFIKKSC